MIHDRIENLSRHALPQADAIVSFLRANDVLKIPVGEIEINGRELFVRPSEYETRKPEEGKFETHRVYADLQYVVKGEEIIETAPSDALLPLTEYDPKGDCQFFKASRSISSQLVRTGEFMVFFPGEAHRPCCSPHDTPVKVKKLVFKIRIG
jgi:YhcH/YjgK/YiaL family protein